MCRVRDIVVLALAVAVFALYVWIVGHIALHAQRKGQSYVVFFAIGFLVSPLLSGLIVLLLRDPLRDLR